MFCRPKAALFVFKFFYLAVLLLFLPQSARRFKTDKIGGSPANDPAGTGTNDMGAFIAVLAGFALLAAWVRAGKAMRPMVTVGVLTLFIGTGGAAADTRSGEPGLVSLGSGMAIGAAHTGTSNGALIPMPPAREMMPGRTPATSSIDLAAGIGDACLDKGVAANCQESDGQLTADNDANPVFHFKYPFSRKWTLELGLRRDLYSGKMDRRNPSGSGSRKGCTLLLGPVYSGDPIAHKFIGPVTPVVNLNLGYAVLYDDTDYPITGFEPAWGGDIAAGLQRRNMALRLGYRYYHLDRAILLSGLTPRLTDDTPDLVGFFMELSYRFSVGKAKMEAK